MKKGLAVFDFDGTITRKDTFIDFLSFSFGRKRLYFTLLKYCFQGIAYAIGIYPNYKYKELIFSAFFKGKTEDFAHRLGEQYARMRIPEICYPQALERISFHSNQGHDLILLTASPAFWIQAWSDSLGFDIIPTKFGLKNGVFTGKIDGKNCYGREKILRLREKYDISAYAQSYGYGDSKSDLYFMELMKEYAYKPFRN
jgi:HAD superfamily hydrolase (TIGR01490 family)